MVAGRRRTRISWRETGGWIGVAMLMFLVVSSLAGCGKAETGPPPIAYGRDAGDRCGMIISDKRFAAAYRLEDGSVKKFDDPAEMTLILAQEETQPVGVWVKDYDTQEWLDAASATYVRSAILKSPMGFNVAAFGSKERALEVAGTDEGETVEWADLAGYVKEHPPAGMKMNAEK